MSNIERLETFIGKLSEIAYKDLPLDEKGFNNYESLFEALEVNEHNINALGPLVTSNRVFQIAWRAGYESRLADEVVDLMAHDVDKLERLEEE